MDALQFHCGVARMGLSILNPTPHLHKKNRHIKIVYSVSTDIKGIAPPVTLGNTPFHFITVK